MGNFKNIINSLITKDWIRSILILIGLFVLGQIVPSKSLDPWDIINLNKVINLVLLLCGVQFASKILAYFVGNREGIFITGLMGGFVSSTAMTLKMAKKTKRFSKKETFNQSILFLTSTMAMLIEAIVFIFVILKGSNLSLLLIFAGPIVMTIGLMIFWAYNSTHKNESITQDFNLNFSSSLQLTAFILVILSLSKIAKNLFGKMGLVGLTGLVSLFEVHGSIIANLQLYQGKGLNLSFLGLLIFVSLLSSYISKILIVMVTGSPCLKKIILGWALLIVSSLAITSFIFNLIT